MKSHYIFLSIILVFMLAMFNYSSEKFSDEKKIDSNFTKSEKKDLSIFSGFKIYMIGQSHIDAAWLWRKSETIEKCRFTFNQAIEHIKKYPGFIYVQSAPQYYKWAEEYFPEISKKIDEAVKNGGWEYVGGEWIEPDNNLPDGESIVRQRLLGQRYYLKRFGKLSEVSWIPDSFGFNYNLPQILAKTGAKYFLTTKITWNDTNNFPFNIFTWRAPDGSEVLAYLGIRGYGIFPKPYPEDIEKFKSQNRLMKEPQIFSSKDMKFDKPELFTEDYVKEIAYLYGESDGGHGPTPKETAAAMELTSLEPWKHGKIIDFFKDLEKYRDKLPTWDDELYLEYHRGTFTSQADIKKLNRQSEVLALSLEKFSSISRFFEHEYPQGKINFLWEKILFNQFHDILPGSSIPEVYLDAKVDYRIIKRIGNELLNESLKNISKNINTEGKGQAVIIFNPLSWERKDIVRIEWPGASNSAGVIDSTGEEIPSQIVIENDKNYLIFFASVPSLGYSVYRILPEKSTSKTSLRVNKDSIENEFIRVNLEGEGWIKSIFDKENNREILKGKGNFLRAYRDKPKSFNAWNIDPKYRNYPYELPKGKIEIGERGPLRASLRVKRNFRNSRFVQEIRLYEGSKLIEMNLKADWKESETLLKLYFPINIETDALVTDIAYGIYKRPTNPESPMEKAKWEFPAHKWVDLSNDDYGVTFLNRSKYGHSLEGSEVCLTLLKSAISPDPKADRGYHSIDYAIFPHRGDWKDSKAYKKGYEFNYPLYGILEANHSGKLPACYSFFEISPENVILHVIKKSEDDESLVMRFYETEGKKVKGEISLPFEMIKASEIDFLELKEISSVEFSGKKVYLDVNPWEIKTIRVVPAK
ncbi:MAG: glycoside hydrolase family 38 C-terminal domain-containing protein [Acidobacteriota bacterium]